MISSPSVDLIAVPWVEVGLRQHPEGSGSGDLVAGKGPALDFDLEVALRRNMGSATTYIWRTPRLGTSRPGLDVSLLKSF